MPLLKRALLPLAAAALGIVAAPALANDTFVAELSGAESVPDPIKTPATGEIKFELVDQGNSLAYTVTVKDLQNPHDVDVHLGQPGSNGPLVLKLFPQGKDRPRLGPVSGVIAQGKFQYDALMGPLNQASLGEFVQELRDGNVYANVHTNDGSDPPNSGPGDYRLGEIRGQFKQVQR
jgi:hypothetical protein